jgi:hypothetical protein
MLVYILALWSVLMVRSAFVTKNVDLSITFVLHQTLTPSWFVAVDVFSIVIIVI